MEKKEKPTVFSKEPTPSYTLNLPQTHFRMRGNLAEKEPRILDFWQSIQLEDKRDTLSKDRPSFTLHDGPPYANGHLHLGHAVNKVAKDTVNRLYWQQGCRTPYRPGWDCHGLPIEAKVLENYEKKGKAKKADIPPLAFRTACREFAAQWIDIQRKEFQRLGVLGLEKEEALYTTMQAEAEYAIVENFFRLCEGGDVYLGLKPVFWSVVEETALAEAEVEYKEITSPSIYVSFPISHSERPVLQDPVLQGVKALIWTTTPWTLPANRAIAYGDLDYVVFETIPPDLNKEAGLSETSQHQKTPQKFLVAKACLKDLKKTAKLDEVRILATLKGDDLKGAYAQHPLYKQGYVFEVPFVKGAHVSSEAGTGLVHTAPAHGLEDFSLANPFNLEVTNLLTPGGVFKPEVPLFSGLHIYKAAQPVIHALMKEGTLFYHTTLTHSYPHSWRSRTPLIYRATPQWFLRLDGREALRKKALQALEKVSFFPEKGKIRLKTMVENRGDWCLSRQRLWGIPLMLFVDPQSHTPLMRADVHAAVLAEIKKNGVDAWWTLDADDFLKPFGLRGYQKVMDILDVWFESGLTHQFVLEASREGKKVADLYLEGSDQHRGWFQSSLVLSAALNKGSAPYRQLLTHGFVVDQKGYKMSKSLGNVITPLDMVQKNGADVLRLWVTSNTLYEDLRVGEQTLKSTQDLYRRFRNTFRFLLGNLNTFPAFFYKQENTFEDAPHNTPSRKDSSSATIPDSQRKELDVEELPLLERMVLARLFKVHEAYQKAFVSYDFSQMVAVLHQFCNQDLSAYYFDIRKDTLYCEPPNSKLRKACLRVLEEVLSALLTWCAPFMPFTTEEAYHALCVDQGYRRGGNVASHKDPHHDLQAALFEFQKSPEETKEKGVPSSVRATGEEHKEVDAHARENTVQESVHLAASYKPPKAFQNDSLLQKFDVLLSIRTTVTAAIEKKRAEGLIKSSLEAMAEVFICDDEIMRIAQEYGEARLAELCLTSTLKLKRAETEENSTDAAQNTPPIWKSQDATNISSHDTTLQDNRNASSHDAVLNDDTNTSSQKASLQHTLNNTSKPLSGALSTAVHASQNVKKTAQKTNNQNVLLLACISLSPYKKCLRCWRFEENVANHLCGRCSKAEACVKKQI